MPADTGKALYPPATGGPGDPPGDPREAAMRALAVLVDCAVQPDVMALLPDRRAEPLPDRGRKPVSLTALLPVVLCVQACLALRLTWSNTAFTDEALYLWAGRLEWAHWLHGTAVPAFPTYFSGAPVLYPPLGALASDIGGLGGARILSLCFMLAATVLLYATAARLHGQRAGLLAAATWASLGPTLHLSAFATFDAMGMFLVAFAAWCVTARRDRDDATGWMLTAALALALANATAYSSAIFDPAVVLLAALSGTGSAKAAVRRGAMVTVITFGAAYCALLLAGGYYQGGVSETVLSRVHGTTAAATVLAQSFSWTGAVTVLAVLGAAVAISQGTRRGLALAVVLAGTALLAPAEQARIHTLTSIDKHADIGAWFAAIAAGYALDWLIRAAPARPGRTIVAAAVTVILAAGAVAGFTQARALFAWPAAGGYIFVLRPLIARTRGPLLIEDAAVAQYYLPEGMQWQRWSTTFSVLLPDGQALGYAGKVSTAGNLAVYERLLARGYFSLVVLNDSSDTPALDAAINAWCQQSPLYHAAVMVPYGTAEYPAWVRTGPPR